MELLTLELDNNMSDGDFKMQHEFFISAKEWVERGLDIHQIPT